LIDFERKYDETPLDQAPPPDDLGDDDEFVTMTDEFGRQRRVPRAQQRAFAQDLSVNVEDDYNEYKPLEQTGYHMVPPVMSQREKRQREAEAQWEFDELVRENEKPDRDRPELDMRDRGPVHYRFSRDEHEREKQQHSLKRGRAELDAESLLSDVLGNSSDTSTKRK
jgi:hypothetical protein